MTHELIKIIRAYETAALSGINAVMATVVALEGSSYRRPGVRMLILEDGTMIGAVSGGCVEKEIRRQAGPVFKTGRARMMVYDGRYRLGCEGILYLLLEPFTPDAGFLESFWKAVKERKCFTLFSYYTLEDGASGEYGTLIRFAHGTQGIRPDFKPEPGINEFRQPMEPCFRLIIIGAEHDAVQLCAYAALTGWEVIVVAPPSEEKTIGDFHGAQEFLSVLPEEMPVNIIDGQTAVMLMTHSYVKDLKFIIRLRNARPAYLGLLGPAARREKILSEVMERFPEVSEHYFESIHGPAGLSIGAETPQEIGISILSEIIAFVRAVDPVPLKDKNGSIHGQ